MSEALQRIPNNADHPRERHVMLLVEEMISIARFPLTRIRLSVEFSAILSDFASHKLNVELRNGRPHGNVSVTYNTLFLMQDPVTFFREVVPHQIAHVLNDVSALRTDQKVLEHGLEWQEWLAVIAETATPSTTYPDAGFDDRAIKLHKGGVLCRCACQGDIAFNVVPNTGPQLSRLKQGSRKCKRCDDVFLICDLSETPPAIKQSLEFIRDDVCKRVNLDHTLQG